MIKSDIIEIPFTSNNNVIENMIKINGIDPLRWSILSVDDDKLVLSVSYET